MKRSNSSLGAILGFLGIVAGLAFTTGIAYKAEEISHVAGDTFWTSPFLLGVVLFMLGICTVCAIAEPEDAKKNALAFGGCLFLLICLPIQATGFPGFSRDWQSVWWIRLLDVLANLIWLLALTLIILAWETSPHTTWPSWGDLGKGWLFVVVPSAIVAAIRWAVIFVVRGPKRAEADPVTNEPPRPPRAPGQAQFLPAARRIAKVSKEA